jgi:hypothetical protein
MSDVPAVMLSRLTSERLKPSIRNGFELSSGGLAACAGERAAGLGHDLCATDAQVRLSTRRAIRWAQPRSEFARHSTSP